MNDVIRVDNLMKKYGRNVVFKDISFTIEPGRIIGLIGNNGLGKTTLLDIIGGYRKQSRGRVFYNGRETNKKEKESIALVDPKQLFPFFTVSMAIDYFTDFFDDFDRKCALRLCEQLKLDQKQKIQKLSKGNQERLCLLLTLSRKGKLYLMDEPFAGIDPQIKYDLKKIILENKPEDATIIIATHLLKELEFLFDEIIILMKDKAILRNCDEIRSIHKKSIEEYYLEVITHV
ncbi:ATP-binding cassette domain-containing protein [Lachnoclostridium phytofermentans]|uniref:ABC transporter related n=1 Tax=Lachnoclostridium phytofermentans (strain ATCC 700394 / DSM 18823 / ISDg) TaxID=357809 RepID=A9KK27_LACP7|nr:ABC transporter ATP-binding protein [Lachnoclostridium phytofermentans]ABX42599.1 ABC transporter related [Lachnoclostridium phytofermentans ISDg]